MPLSHVGFSIVLLFLIAVEPGSAPAGDGLLGGRYAGARARLGILAMRLGFLKGKAAFDGAPSAVKEAANDFVGHCSAPFSR